MPGGILLILKKHNILFRGVALLVARLLWELDAGGSCPFTPTRKNDLFRQVVFSVIFALRQVILLRSYIQHTPSDCASQSFMANIISLQTEFAITLLQRKNITPSKTKHH